MITSLTHSLSDGCLAVGKDCYETLARDLFYPPVPTSSMRRRGGRESIERGLAHGHDASRQPRIDQARHSALNPLNYWTGHQAEVVRNNKDLMLIGETDRLPAEGEDCGRQDGGGGTDEIGEHHGRSHDPINERAWVDAQDDRPGEADIDYSRHWP